VTIPKDSAINEGDVVEINSSPIKKISYMGVVGDLFHYGHLQSVQFAKSISDYCIAGVFTDKAVEEYRIKPIANLKERKAIFASLNCVDRVMVQHARDPTENLKRIHEEFPDAEIILVHGSDLKYVHGSEYIRKIKGKVVQHPYYERLSTFKIINKIIENKDKFKDITDFSAVIKGNEDIDSEYERGNKVIVSTKASTLKALKPLLKKSRIEDMYVFTTSDFKNRKQQILDEIRMEYGKDKIVIRSSAVNEDSLDKSMAGCFSSVLNVNPKNKKQLESAIKHVIDSYKKKSSESSFNQVLVQRQSKDIIMSGVLFTRTLENNAPYYVINYDDSTGETDTVTKGMENKTVKISRFSKNEDIPKEMHGLISAAKEIESKIPKLSLDIEFAVDKKGQVIIFQVRPLTVSFHDMEYDNKVKNAISGMKDKFNELASRRKHLAGERTTFADMPDWNPAEIIGDMPNHLDFSLYDYIITDSAWHEARTSQGYFNVDPAKLVVLFGNKPFIDVRNSFNSFTPSSISQSLREKLVSFYCSKLFRKPELQDKVEFDVVYTCYDLGFDDRSKELVKNNFSKADIDILRKALLKLTNNLVVDSKVSILEDLKYLKEMEKDRQKTVKECLSEKAGILDLLRGAKFLLDDCRKKGTVQFSRLARLGFIGKIILKSLVKKDIISNKFYNDFMNSVATVATEISEDFRLMCSNKLSKEEFIRKYYHLSWLYHKNMALSGNIL
jgi:cytidyltransferase-like protein